MIKLPRIPDHLNFQWPYLPHQLRARDIEVARVVLESAAQAAELWHANGLEVEIAREIRNLEVSHD